MLRKLLKHELIETSRSFIPMILGIIAILLINFITYLLGVSPISDNPTKRGLSFIFIAIYTILAIGFYILTYVFVAMRFYKTMIGKQGYLTHTLPVKTNSIIMSKLLCSVFWQIIVMVLIYISFITILKSYVPADVWLEIKPAMMESISNVYGMTESGAVTFLLATCFIGTFSSSLMFYCSTALGTLFGRYKLAGSVVCYVAIYMLLQFIAMVVMFFSGYFNIYFGKTSEELMNLYYNFKGLMVSMLIITIISSIVMYFITHLIFTKKLNLE